MTTPSAVTGALAAGSAALGVPLADPVPLVGSAWPAVVRCRDGAGRAVVVKTYPPGDAGPGSFAAEAAGLALCGASGLSPRLLAADEGSLTVVMSDLGSAPSLADLLLGSSAAAAGTALVDWARALGELAVYAAGRHEEHAGLLARYLAGRPADSSPAGLGDRICGTAGRAALLGVAEPAGLAADLRSVMGMLESGWHQVFSPGDECPDNNLVAPDGVRFIDFESSGFHSVFVDAAYLRMPFSTCWCVFRLPAGLTRQAEASYRAAVSRVHADLADDTFWQPGVRRGIAAWTLSSMWWLLDRALASDTPLHSERLSPGSRQLLRHRWRVLAAELNPAGEMPALAVLMADLLAATEHWQVPELASYPALTSAQAKPGLPGRGGPGQGQPR